MSEYEAAENTLMRRRIHMCVDTMNAIRNMPERELQAMFKGEGGKSLTVWEILDALKDDLRKGHDYYCGCDNRKPDGRCAGHAIQDEEAP